MFCQRSNYDIITYDIYHTPLGDVYSNDVRLVRSDPSCSPLLPDLFSPVGRLETSSWKISEKLRTMSFSAESFSQSFPDLCNNPVSEICRRFLIWLLGMCVQIKPNQFHSALVNSDQREIGRNRTESFVAYDLLACCLSGCKFIVLNWVSCQLNTFNRHLWSTLQITGL